MLQKKRFQVLELRSPSFFTLPFRNLRTIENFSHQTVTRSDNSEVSVEREKMIFWKEVGRSHSERGGGETEGRNKAVENEAYRNDR